MPISNEHLNGMCQVWDGVTYYMMDEKEAEKAEKDGKVQRTKNLQAKDLKPASAFRKRAPRKKKQTYATREMKAEDVST